MRGGEGQPRRLSPEVQLWRRVPPQHFPRHPGRTYPNSDAFVDGRGGEPMSVVIGDDVLAAGRSPWSVLAGHEGFALASVTVGEVQALGLRVEPDPTPHEPCHAVVLGRKTRSVSPRLAAH